jgi:hypothetical protein
MSAQIPATATDIAASNSLAEPKAMTKGEREDLQRLVRQREKVLKSAAKQRSAELLADFENQMGSEFSFDDDAIWQQAAREAGAEVERAKQRIAARCRELGIPKQFAPTLSMVWHHRGYGNILDERRKELRCMAQAQVEAIEAKAVTEIEMSCLEAQTQLAIAGLTSEAARGFVAKLPAIETLMPRLSFAEIAGEVEPPVAEQLISPNALRQRRYRERQALRRDGGALRAPADGKSSEAQSHAPPAADGLDIPDYLDRTREAAS